MTILPHADILKLNKIERLIMKTTRERVLQTLSSHPRSSIIEIAKDVGINAISVRHHITGLQAAGQVTSEEERHGVGRPRMVYVLTEKGLEHFPTSYLRLTNNLLDQLKRTISQKELDEIFKKMADKLTDEYKSSLVKLSLEEKLHLLEEVMAREGFEMKWEHIDDHYQLNEISCPFYRIGKNHPEVCLFDKTLIANMLSIPLNKIQMNRSGDVLCSFIILENI